MAQSNADIDSKAYLAGEPLNEAALKFASPESTQRYKTFMVSRPCAAGTDRNVGTLIGALEHIQAQVRSKQNHQDQLSASIEGLYRDVLFHVRSGVLVPYGYKLPRQLSDDPIGIPIDMFLDGVINWDCSELLYRDFAFIGGRLIGNAPKGKGAPSIEPALKETSIEKITKGEAKGEKPIVPLFADLDPDLYIDDKRAAEYLGVSHRTLQGYRLKGGGPEFLKISHKVVRYKVSDLIAWAESRKRKNTSG